MEVIYGARITLTNFLVNCENLIKGFKKSLKTSRLFWKKISLTQVKRTKVKWIGVWYFRSFKKFRIGFFITCCYWTKVYYIRGVGQGWLLLILGFKGQIQRVHHFLAIIFLFTLIYETSEAFSGKRMTIIGSTGHASSVVGAFAS